MSLASSIDVVVGDDVAGGIDDEAGAERHHLARTRVLPAELTEEELKRRSGRDIGRQVGGCAGLGVMDRRNIDDCRRHFFRQRRKALWSGSGQRRRARPEEDERQRRRGSGKAF